MVQGENMVTATVRSHSDDLSRRCSSGAFDLNDCVLENSGNWSVLSTDGDEPTPRFNVMGNWVFVQFPILIKNAI